MDRPSIPSILYDLAVTIGEQTSLKPLLERTLQHLLHYTGFAAGLICLDLPSVEGQEGELASRIDAAAGDADLISATGMHIAMPRELLAGKSRQSQAMADILARFGRVQGRYRSFLRLPLGANGAIILLAPGASPTRRPLSRMLKPVLAHLGRAIEQCRRNDDRTAELLSERQLYSAVFSSSSSGVMITDLAGLIVAVNPAFTRITGYAAEEVLDHNPRLLASGRHDPEFFRELWRDINERGYWQGEIWNRRKNGEAYPEWLSISPVRDAQGKTTHHVGIFSDLSAEKETESMLHQMAFYDSLTKLPNRRLLLDRLRQACLVSARSGQLGALLFVDLDDFKSINDSKGHEAGNLLLKQVARRLLGCVREGDTVARLGGDEFVLIANALDTDETESAAHAEALAKNIQRILLEPYQLRQDTVHTSPSIGIAMIKGQQETSDNLLKHADISMCRAKQDGGNGIRFFDPKMQSEINTRTALIEALRTAVRREQFKLLFQAQLDSQRRITGAEVLLRWHHPERGLVSPLEFIPLAEEISLIIPIGLWVLRAACEQLERWRHGAHTCALTLAVNISARQFRQADFVDQVRRIIDETGADPSLLKLELTEGVMLENVDQVIASMRELKRLGLNFSLDDFGTGYSSLQYLKKLPLDQVKIDQSFIRDITTDPNGAAIVLAMIAMADALALQIIAEGVETQAQQDFLELHGCHHYQGFLYSQPLAAAEFEDFASACSLSH